MKLEVGMYVRTKNGYIRKIDRIWNDTDFNVDKIYYNDNIDEDTLGCVLDEDISKASHNIMDLIGERDFVKVRIDGIFINWFMVDLFEDENENQELGIGCYEDGLLNTISEYRPLDTLEILEVLTKEQFESMSYKVN